MYQSKIPLSKKTTSENKSRVRKIISDHNFCRCGVLKRNVSLIKFYDSNAKRKSASIRFQSFFSGIDILKHSKQYKKETIDGYTCFEIEGREKNGEIIFIHLREEIVNKDKVLFLISTFC